MSNKTSTVLVVDDSAADLQITMSAVSSQYKVLAAKNGEQALNMMEKVKADVVLLDVNMPNMDGYETCQKMIAKNSDVDIVFISSNDSTEEIIKGYELGGSDYIVKPVMPDVLLNKVSKLIDDKASKAALKQEMEMASKVAMTAMSSSGELSVILEFLRNSFQSQSLEQLSELFKSALLGFEMQASFEFRLLEERQLFSNTGEVSPIEVELLARISTMRERISEHGRRLFINNGNVSLLIKNLPVEDDEKTGRLRDYLAILVEGATEKVETISQQKRAAEQRSESIDVFIEEANASLNYIHETQKDIEKKNTALLDELVHGVEEAFVGLELTDEQENKILDLLSEAQDKSSHLFDKNVQLENELESIMTKFRQVAS